MYSTIKGRKSHVWLTEKIPQLKGISVLHVQLGSAAWFRGKADALIGVKTVTVPCEHEGNIVEVINVVKIQSFFSSFFFYTHTRRL